MQTQLPSDFAASPVGQLANDILRSCVHCGFCLATCPTYQVDRNELDSPRGRIYLIKQMLEGQDTTSTTRTHLDRCLTCRSCETTCPSGVRYHELLDIGRAEVESRAPRAWPIRSGRWLLRQILSRRDVFTPLLRLGQLVRPLIPGGLREKVPPRAVTLRQPETRHRRQMILAQGCVQPGLSPRTNAATARVLDRLGISILTVPSEVCCGALSHHLSAPQAALEQARRNIDLWWPLIDSGQAESLLMTASGCSIFVRDYARLLEHDEAYAQRAQRVSESVRDVSQVLADENLEGLQLNAHPRISWHCPCTAQHGQSIDAATRLVLERLGFELPAITDAHLCCGSAGTYSLFQPRMAGELRRRKLTALQASKPERILTANIGCQVHLGATASVPVTHWIELVDELLKNNTDR